MSVRFFFLVGALTDFAVCRDSARRFHKPHPSMRKLSARLIVIRHGSRHRLEAIELENAQVKMCRNHFH